MESFQIIDIILNDSSEMLANNALVEALQTGLASHFLRIQDHSFPSVISIEMLVFSYALTCCKELHDRMCEMTLRAFAWPLEVKSAMSMANSKHFLGFTSRSDEMTNDLVDNREVGYARPYLAGGLCTITIF